LLHELNNLRNVLFIKMCIRLVKYEERNIPVVHQCELKSKESDCFLPTRKLLNIVDWSLSWGIRNVVYASLKRINFIMNEEICSSINVFWFSGKILIDSVNFFSEDIKKFLHLLLSFFSDLFQACVHVSSISSKFERFISKLLHLFINLFNLMFAFRG